MYDLEEINKRATETIKAIANGKAEMAGFAWTILFYPRPVVTLDLSG